MPEWFLGVAGGPEADLSALLVKMHELIAARVQFRLCRQWRHLRHEECGILVLCRREVRLAAALVLAVDMQQFIQCQIARSILYCSIIIVGPFKEAKSQVQGLHEYELLNLPKRQRA